MYETRTDAPTSLTLQKFLGINEESSPAQVKS